MYIKRHNVGKFWPVTRKGTKYLAVSRHNKKDSIPIIVVMRDILKLVRNKKELKKIISEKQVLVNNREVRDDNFPICLFDIISLPTLKKNYCSVFSPNKKIEFKEIEDKKSDRKVFKVINKKKIKGDKIQVNLTHGRNLITNEKLDIDDCIVFNFKKNKVEKIIKMKIGVRVYVVNGKHMGTTGKIDGIIERGGKKLVKIINEKNDEKINVWLKNVIAIED